MQSKSSLKNDEEIIESVDEKKDFLEKSNLSLSKIKVSKMSQSVKNEKEEQDYANQGHNDKVQQQEEDLQQDDHDHQSRNKLDENAQEQNNSDNQNQDHSHDKIKFSRFKQNKLQNDRHHLHQDTQIIKETLKQSENQIKSLINQLKNQLSQLNAVSSNNNSHNQSHTEDNQRKRTELQHQIQILQIKLRLQLKLQTNKQLISIQRINHLEHIFKHYCTHIFKTGKHMTFDRLQYQKVHLAIDRFFIFVKDFNLTTFKAKDGKTREIVEKQQIIKLFKKVSPNCKDLNFQQFIIMIQKLGELYFDSRRTYQERKQTQKKERLKLKEQVEKKQKYKQQMMKKHEQKLFRLQQGIQKVKEDSQQKVNNEYGQNDNLLESLMKGEAQQPLQGNKSSKVQVEKKQEPKILTVSKIKKSESLYNKTFKKQLSFEAFKKPQNPLLSLTKQEKIEFFYEIINIDDLLSFSDKLRELHLPLFKIYTSQQKIKKNQYQQDKSAKAGSSKEKEDEQKRLKQLRLMLNERNQKVKKTSVSSISKEEYEQRKIRRLMLQQQEAYGMGLKKKSNKINLSDTEISLESLSKLSFENVNFKKLNFKSLFSKEDDDNIFLKQYDSPVVVERKPVNNYTQERKVSQNTKRMIDQKEKNSQSFLPRLKQRQSQVELASKKTEVSQLYRFNDKTQRQKRLIDKFLDKNK